MAERILTDAEQLKDTRFTEDVYAKIAAYADEHSMSVSEVVREIVEAYASGGVKAKRRPPRHRRVAFRIQPTAWSKFRARALREKMPMTDAVEAAAKEYL